MGLEDQNVPKITIRTTTRTLPFTRSNDNKNTFYSSCSDSLYFRDFRPYKMFSRNVAARLRSPHETERRGVPFIPWAKLVDGQYENCLLTKFGACCTNKSRKDNGGRAKVYIANNSKAMKCHRYNTNIEHYMLYAY